MSPLTEEQAYQKLASQCAVSEQCVDDVRRKLQRWTVIGDVEAVIDRLVKERFIDEHRYARAFALDKFRYNHWGREMIRMEMKRRHIATADIEYGLSEIPEEEYTAALVRLLDNKRPSVKGKNEYEVKQKLIRYAIGKGYEMEEIIRIIQFDA